MVARQDLRDEILGCARKYQQSAGYSASDRVVGRAFQQKPFNNNFDEVLLKTAVLSSRYQTDVYGERMQEIARHIVERNLDHLLNSGQVKAAVSLVRDPWDKHKEGVYSHATKYCHWHRPGQFPMYDTNVSKALVELGQELGLNSIRDKDLWDFVTLKNTVDKVRLKLALIDWTYKQMDEALWIYGQQVKVTGRCQK